MVDDVLVVGHGNFANAILSDLMPLEKGDSGLELSVIPWDERHDAEIEYDSCSIVHVGSGRQLVDAISYCLFEK